MEAENCPPVYAGRDRNTARLTLGVGLAVSAFPLSAQQKGVEITRFYSFRDKN
jgi:hypothetical protein